VTLDGLFRELKRRRVFHVAGVYAVACWLLVQTVAVAAPALGLPEWTTRLVIAFTFVAFPLALAGAWLVPPRAGRPAAVSVRDGGTGAAPGLARYRRLTVLLLGALASGAVGYVAFIRPAPPPPAPEAPPGSVMVLPFDNIGGDPEDEYFSDGVTEDILTQLAKVEGLKVISRTTAMRYKGTTKPPREIGAELGVATVLEGGVRMADGRVRVSVQLVDAGTEQHVWAETYDRELADIFAIQSDIARRIAGALKSALAPATAAAAQAAAPTADMEAYRLYLRGRFFWNRRTEEGLRLAIRQFEEALARDPELALAHAGLADAYVVLPFHSTADRAVAHDTARSASERAIELDPRLGAPHAALGYVHFWRREWAASGAAFRRALELSPGYATAHQWYAFLQAYLGQVDEAIATTRHALELDPLSAIINWNLAFLLQYARHWDAALEQYDRTLELDPGLVVAHEQVLRIHEYRRDFAAYVHGYERYAAAGGGGAFSAADVRTRYAEGGWPGVFRLLLDQPEGPTVTPLRRAEWHAALGEHDQALTLLEEEEAAGAPVEIRSASFDVLRDEPRFRALTDRLGVAGGTADRGI
jgi:TolB-like protein/Tfp pilus assembly protein PilF